MLAEKGSSLLNKPICQNLCTKALYTPGGNLQNLVETNPFSNYWCNYKARHDDGGWAG